MRKIIIDPSTSSTYNLKNVAATFNELLDILAEEGIIELEEDNIKEIKETEEA